jgi:hypothetical protein
MAEQNTALNPDFTFTWQEIAAALFKANGISEGWWRVGVRMRFAALTSQLNQPNSAMPTAFVGVEGAAFFRTTEGGSMVYDAGNGAAPVPEGAIYEGARKPAGKARRTPAKKSTA